MEDTSAGAGGESPFSWRSPSSRLVLTAVQDLLAEQGFEAVTAEAVRLRAGAAGPALGEAPDVVPLVAAALDQIELFSVPEPTGCLRGDLQALMRTWRGPRTREEVVVGAVLCAAERHPQLKAAVFRSLDRPLARAVGAVLARATADGRLATPRALTLSWVLRGLMLDRLRSGARSAVDIDQLVDFLLAGFDSWAEAPTGRPAGAGA